MKELDLVTSPLDGISLIEASAGTGKTYTIAALFVRLILEKRLNVNEILVVTFTRAATEELKDRIRRKLKAAIMTLTGSINSDTDLNHIIAKVADINEAERRLGEALRDFDEAAIHTIHGFCHQVLQDNAFESGNLFDSELVKEQESLVQQIADDFRRRLIQQSSSIFMSFLAARGYFNGAFDLVLRLEYSGRQLKIVPPVERLDLKRQENIYLQAYTEICHAWPVARKDVENLLSSFAGLDRRRYNPAKIGGFLGELDACLAGNAVLLLEAENLEKFTATYLKNSTRKGYDFPGLPVFALFEGLYAEREKLLGLYNKRLLGLKIESAEYLQRELEIRKATLKIQYYDDLLTRLKGALEGSSGPRLVESIRGRLKAALIDEFQDTDPLQYEIFETIFGRRGGPLFLIGDPKQAIYSFRGADIFAYLKAAGQAQNKYTLRHNWRAEPKLIGAVNELFSHVQNPFVFDDIRFFSATPGDRGLDQLTIDRNGEPPLQLWFVDSAAVEPGALPKSEVITKSSARKLIARAVADEIARLLNPGYNQVALIGDRSVTAGDMAVLVRTNREGILIRQALNRRNIPAVLFSIENVFDSREAQQLQLILTAISRPASESALKAALATDILGVTGEEIYTLTSNEIEWARRLARFEDYHQSWNRHGFIRMFERFMVAEGVRPRLMALADGERRLTNVLHLTELLHRQDRQQPAGIAGLIKWLARTRQSSSQRIDEHQLRLESDENAVKIVTIHKSKGLQYPIVFCPFNWSGSKLRFGENVVFHDETSNYGLTLDLGSDDYEGNQVRAETELLAENLRLLYVAMTRAINRCYLIWGKFNRAETSAPAYLFHRPASGDRHRIVADTAVGFLGLSDREIVNRLKEYETRAGDKIKVSNIPKAADILYAPPPPVTPGLTSRKFSGVIEAGWRITSFSQLTSARHYPTELPDRDYPTTAIELHLPAAESTVAEQKPIGIFALPKGVKTGNLIHDIFEKVDFQNCDSPESINLINRKLREHGFDLSWQPVIAQMLANVARMPLVAGGDKFRLEQVGSENRLNELEFYFPLKKIDQVRFKSIISGHGRFAAINTNQEYLDRLQFSPVQGFMKGFVDLVFRRGEKFYIVDWKSNHLGDRPEDYSPQRIAAVMQGGFYTLQYILYTVALDRYLSLRMPGYSYENNYGGVFYLFIRGIDPDISMENGIFTDRLAAEFIGELSEYLVVNPGEASE